MPSHIHTACHKCGHTKRTRPSKLVQAARWKYTWCAGACQKNSTSSKWLCICKKPWHSCELHARCQLEPPRQPKPVRRIGAPNAHKSVPLTCPSTSTNPNTKHHKSHDPTLPPSGPTPPQPLPPPPEASLGFNLATPQPATTTKTELVRSLRSNHPQEICEADSPSAGSPKTPPEPPQKRAGRKGLKQPLALKPNLQRCQCLTRLRHLSMSWRMTKTLTQSDLAPLLPLSPLLRSSRPPSLDLLGLAPLGPLLLGDPSFLLRSPGPRKVQSSTVT